MPRSTETIPGAGSARKVLDLLFCFSTDRPVWTAHELARAIVVSSATVYRYIALLRDVGLVDDDGYGNYRLSMRTTRLAAAAEAGRSTLEAIALPVMTRIRDEINETVLFARRVGDSAITIERVETQQPIQLRFDVGQRTPLYRGAMARVLLAALPREERDAYLAATFPGGRPEELSDEALAVLARDGYAENFGEIDEGIWGTGAAIRMNGVTVAALGVAAPLYRLDERARARIIEVVRAGADEVSALATSDGI